MWLTNTSSTKWRSSFSICCSIDHRPFVICCSTDFGIFTSRFPTLFDCPCLASCCSRVCIVLDDENFVCAHEMHMHVCSYAIIMISLGVVSIDYVWQMSSLVYLRMNRNKSIALFATQTFSSWHLSSPHWSSWAIALVYCCVVTCVCVSRRQWHRPAEEEEKATTEGKDLIKGRRRKMWPAFLTWYWRRCCPISYWLATCPWSFGGSTTPQCSH